jgi:hypothetical protein
MLYISSTIYHTTPKEWNLEVLKCAISLFRLERRGKFGSVTFFLKKKKRVAIFLILLSVTLNQFFGWDCK